MSDPIVKWALFFRAYDKSITDDWGIPLVPPGPSEPKGWTLEQLFDQEDDAIKLSTRVLGGYQTAISKVVIERPTDPIMTEEAK